MPCDFVASIVSISAGIISPQQLRHVLKPRDQCRRHVDAGEKHEREMRKHWHVGRLGLPGGAAGIAERDGIQSQEQRGDADQDAGYEYDRQPWLAREGLTNRNSLMKMPSGGSPAMATTPSTSPQPSTGLVSVSPPISAMRCVPLT
jgi:hypothetical protein